VSRLPTREAAGRALAATGRRLYVRGWVLGTSGNFSAVVSWRPFRLAITPSAAHKGSLGSDDLLIVDRTGRTVPERRGKPSAETMLHLEIVAARGAAAVLHTHSVWSTILSDLHARDAGVSVSGYEMLKGLDGVHTHEHEEWIPIVDNDQDMPRLAQVVRRVLKEHPRAHAFLLRRHGLYTWGRTIAEAERQVEVLEFLFEASGRRSSWPS
jgi:methylthioribulose-1-phosphate dehydratase